MTFLQLSQKIWNEKLHKPKLLRQWWIEGNVNRNRNSQIHPQKYQSTGNQYDSHGEPGIIKQTHKFSEREKVPIKCSQGKKKHNWKKHEQEHTSQLWEEGTISSSFLAVKISIPTKWHLAWPCLPVLEVETSTTCHRGNPFTHQSQSIKT